MPAHALSHPLTVIALQSVQGEGGSCQDFNMQHIVGPAFEDADLLLMRQRLWMRPSWMIGWLLRRRKPLGSQRLPRSQKQSCRSIPAQRWMQLVGLSLERPAALPCLHLAWPPHPPQAIAVHAAAPQKSRWRLPLKTRPAGPHVQHSVRSQPLSCGGLPRHSCPAWQQPSLP